MVEKPEGPDEKSVKSFAEVDNDNGSSDDLSTGRVSEESQEQWKIDSKFLLQRYKMRWLLYVFCLITISFLFYLFWEYIFSPCYLGTFIQYTGLAILVATILGLVPTILLITLISVTFRASHAGSHVGNHKGNAEGNEFPQATLKVLDISSKTSGILKLIFK